MLKRNVTFDRLKFILEHLNKNVEVLALVDEKNCRIYVKIGSICYKIEEKLPIFTDETKKFYEIIRFLNEKAIKIESFGEIL